MNESNRPNPGDWKHTHNFVTDSTLAEKRTRIVIGITATMMFVEILGGLHFHSMAVLADGWHMGTHVSAFLITAIAYHLTRKHANDPRFSFGPGKFGVLGGFASAVVLSVVAFLMAGESIYHFLFPLQIQFTQAIGIACVALFVNLVCAFLLNVDDYGHDHHHGHGHSHSHDEQEHGHSHEGEGGARDLNLRAAYLHVLADAMTTLAAIGALLAGKIFGLAWLDPVVGMAGSVVIFSWALSLLGPTSAILLDQTPASTDLPDVIRQAIESDGASQVTDLHIWQLNTGKYAAIISIAAQHFWTADDYRSRLREHRELVHVTVEIRHCAPEITNAEHQAPDA